MSDSAVTSRSVRIPSRASRIAILIGVALVIASGYFFFAPLDRTLLNGIIVQCGSAVRPITNADVMAQCAALPGQELTKGIVLAAIGLVLILGSSFVFGTDIRVDVSTDRTDG